VSASSQASQPAPLAPSQSTATRRLLVTSALPYANGPLHIGHLVEYVQTDIFVRHQRMGGHECHYVGADDAHGTPIMLRALAEGTTPEAVVARFGESHQNDFRDFGISFDNYYVTHSEENRHFAELIYTRLREAGHIARHEIEQLFDPERGMFLPDRYIKGECPRCGAQDQYGDSCEVCGASYPATELKNPRSALSGATPVLRPSEHYFFQLGHFEALLRDWLAGAGRPPVQPEIAHKLDEWFEAGLKDWDISRDAPYFGFEIPDAPGKYFYVWLDAPIGYMASFRHYCNRTGLDFEAFWQPDSQAELHHFIGKDIAYFHTLFWPAMLGGAGFRLPTAVHCHGFLTVNGQKMSKSRGTFITARTWLDYFPAEALRYYFAAKLGSGIDDLDLNLEDFQQRVNADLVGKLVNIPSRTVGFLHKFFGGELAATLPAPELFNRACALVPRVQAQYEGREYGSAVREIMALADEANAWIQDHAPWTLAKDPERLAEVQGVCTQALNLYRVLIGALKPVLPQLAAASETLLECAPLTWANLSEPILGHRVAPYRALLTRIDSKQIEALLAANAATLSQVDSNQGAGAGAPEPTGAEAATHVPLAETISIEQFGAIDLRVARILEAEAVPGADKLLRLKLDLGFEQRQVFAGIKSAYAPEQLVGRLTVMVANLKPRQMKFGLSEGMVLAASGPQAAGIYLLAPDQGAQPGMRIK